MKTTFTFHEDPAHGWLEVPLSLVKSLGLNSQISPYSYVDTNKQLAYLEEDCDATKFIFAYKKEYGEESIGFDIKYYDNECFIRNLKGF
jgi:hypothetical protein